MRNMVAIGAALALAGAPAAAQQASAPGTPAPQRLYGHLSYADVDRAQLVPAPEGFAVGQPCLVRPELIPDLQAMMAAAQADGVPGTLHAISCHRSIAHQRSVFCNRGGEDPCRDAAQRARSVAPAGHSEHATGYAIDFGVRPQGDCPDVDYCFASTPIGKWLVAHAPDFGFELSFPWRNVQGVTWEPWHWRWVGRSNSAPGALAARATFSAARTQFPGDPRIPTIVVRVIAQPPVPGATAVPAAAGEATEAGA